MFGLILLCVLLAVEGCPSGWTQDGIKCYFFSDLKGSWAEAASYCGQFTAKLAEPDDQHQMAFLSGMVQSEPSSTNEYFLGGSDMFVESEWIWTSSLKQISTSNWEPGEPNDQAHHEDCLAITNTGHLNDVPCSHLLTFICESENEISSVIGK